MTCNFYRVLIHHRNKPDYQISRVFSQVPKNWTRESPRQGLILPKPLEAFKSQHTTMRADVYGFVPETSVEQAGEMPSLAQMHAASTLLI